MKQIGSDVPVILVKTRKEKYGLKSFLFCEKISVGRTVPFAVDQNDWFFHSKGKRSLFWPNIYDKLLTFFETFVAIQSRGSSIWQSNALLMVRIFEKRLLFSRHQFNPLVLKSCQLSSQFCQETAKCGNLDLSFTCVLDSHRFPIREHLLKDSFFVKGSKEITAAFLS